MNASATLEGIIEMDLTTIKESLVKFLHENCDWSASNKSMSIATLYGDRTAEEIYPKVGYFWAGCLDKNPTWIVVGRIRFKSYAASLPSSRTHNPTHHV